MSMLRMLERMDISLWTYRQRRPSSLETFVRLLGRFRLLLSYSSNTYLKTHRMSYVPLIAPSTSINRVKFLASIADSFIYVVSKMGVTGSSAGVAISASLPELLARIRSFTPVPLAVGFGVDNRTHFDFVTAAGADGVVIGTRIIKVVEGASASTAPAALEAYCREISLKGQELKPLGRKNPNGDAQGHPDPVLPIPVEAPTEGHSLDVKPGRLPSKFGLFGGAFVPESLVDCLEQLEDAYVKAAADPEFWKEFEDMYGYMNRPSNLYLAERLTEHMGGAKIYLKREDLNHTGSHKLNNAVGQILLAKRLGKKRIIAETGAGQHGVATATVCARFGMECVIYMGAEDVRRQELNVFRIKMLGAKVSYLPLKYGADPKGRTRHLWNSNTQRCGQRSNARMGYPIRFDTLFDRFRHWTSSFPNHRSRFPTSHW